MMTFVSRIPFTYVKKGVWVSHPHPYRICQNVTITRTLRATEAPLTGTTRR